MGWLRFYTDLTLFLETTINCQRCGSIWKFFIGHHSKCFPMNLSVVLFFFGFFFGFSLSFGFPFLKEGRIRGLVFLWLVPFIYSSITSNNVQTKLVNGYICTSTSTLKQITYMYSDHLPNINIYYFFKLHVLYGLLYYIFIAINFCEQMLWTQSIIEACV